MVRASFSSLPLSRALSLFRWPHLQVRQEMDQEETVAWVRGADWVEPEVELDQTLVVPKPEQLRHGPNLVEVCSAARRGKKCSGTR